MEASSMNKKHILKNLHSLIRDSALHYMNEFVWQDVELTEEFKKAYERYLTENSYDIEFLGSTAVITSPSAKFIFVPNQWFVMAHYTVDVYEELSLYKEYFKKVARKLGRKYDEYAKLLRDSASSSDRNEFTSCARDIFSSICYDNELVEEAVARLWRFVNDYAWWSGQKTIDRGDFYVSVILNMLNLVNVSQGFVADIVSAYSTDAELRHLVSSIDAFTINMGDVVVNQTNYSDEEINTKPYSDDSKENKTIPSLKRVRIKIKESSSFKEINVK